MPDDRIWAGVRPDVPVECTGNLVVQLILDDNQAKLVRHSAEPVELIDQTGNRIGILPRPDEWTPQELAETERLADSDGPWYTTAEVLDHLKTLGPE